MALCCNANLYTETISSHENCFRMLFCLNSECKIWPWTCNGVIHLNCHFATFFCRLSDWLRLTTCNQRILRARMATLSLPPARAARFVHLSRSGNKSREIIARSLPLLAFPQVVCALFTFLRSPFQERPQESASIAVGGWIPSSSRAFLRRRGNSCPVAR